MGRRTKTGGRDIHGLLLLDKPVGLTSARAVEAVKRLYRARKVGHTGSLDPIATGLLLICLGEATKLSAYLLEADKRYRTTCRLGIKTTTGDAEGEVSARQAVDDYSGERIEAVLAGLRGPISQVPPMHSAVKYKGQRLYKLARDGIEVPREPRTVTVHELRVVERTRETLTLDLSCSKGTYVRTLVEAIGEALGCGAYVTELRRLGLGPYVDPQMIPLERLSERAEAEGPASLDAELQPLDSALAQWPSVRLSRELAFYLRSGQAVQAPGAPSQGLVRLYDEGEQFLGVGQVWEDGRIGPKRLLRVG